MSHSKNNKMLGINGFVDFESTWNLQITAGVISDHLFAGVSFSEEIPGLREEVPAVALTKEVLGFTAVLYGEYGNERFHFTLAVSPSETLFSQLGADRERLDIGKWFAQLVDAIPELKVVGYSPC